MINKKAFTLAEVLITIVIIGVIAAISVPILFENYTKEETITRLKKAYSVLSQTTALAIAEEGPIVSWKTENTTASQFAGLYVKPYLNIMQDCNTRTTGNCAFKYSPLNSKSVSSLNNTWDRFYLADGQLVAFRTPTNTKDGISSLIYVDINGKKKPNKLGRDVFVFIYWVYHPSNVNATGKFIPYGGDWSRAAITGTGYPYCCNRQKTGELCAALIVKDSWRISKDYPW